MHAVFLDIETTGLDQSKHHPIDIAFKIIDFNTQKEICSFQSLISCTPEEWEQRDLNSIEVNGYTWEEIEKAESRSVVGQKIIQIFTEKEIVRGSSVYICQNPGFDRSFFSQLVDIYTQEDLNWPYHWLDFASMFWAINVKRNDLLGQPFPETINLSKNEIAKAYNIPPEKTPHKANNGVDHLIACYSAVFDENFSLLNVCC